MTRSARDQQTTTPPSSPVAAKSADSYTSDYCREGRILAPEMCRIVVGFSTNMWLRGFATLTRNPMKSMTEFACEQLFASSVTSDASLANFVATLTRRDSIRWIVSTSTDCGGGAAAWELVGGGSDGGAAATIELVGSAAWMHSHLMPIILSVPAEHLSTRAQRTDCIGGPTAIALRAAGICAVFELFRGQGQALYLCVQENSSGRGSVSCSPEPARDETLQSFAARNVASGSTTACFSLVHCMVDCVPNDWYKLAGTTTDAMVAELVRLLADNVLGAIDDPRKARIDIWHSVRRVLPAVHFCVSESFRQCLIDISYDRGCSGLTAYGSSEILAHDSRDAYQRQQQQQQWWRRKESEWPLTSLPGSATVPGR